MIPFYEQRLDYIRQELDEKTKRSAPQSDLDFLKNTLLDVERKLEAEVREVNILANLLDDKWNAIQDLRTK
jgi:vacuolar-type H+-ATPase subunit D/Vma8